MPRAALSADRVDETASLADAEVVARVRAGDVAAFEGLYATYRRPLWKFAYHYVQSSAAAEDVVQTVFATLWERRAAWSVSASIKLWLYGAVRNQALNYRRHAAVVRRVEDAAGGTSLVVGEAPPRPDVALEASALTATLRAAVAALPERTRLALTLRWHHELGYAEIGQVLGVSTAAAHKQVAKAERALRPLLEAVRHS